MNYKSAKYIFIFFILILAGASCDREKQIPVPYVYVNYTVYLSNPSNNNLKNPGGYLVLPDEGNLGIILYRRYNFGDAEDFIALDLTCSNEPLESCKLELDEDGFYLVCPCCRSKFSVFDGLVAEGPARWPLKEYTTTYLGNTVRISN